MNKQSHNDAHKHALKSALSGSYDNILKGTKMKQAQKKSMSTRRWAIAGMAALLIVGGIAGVGLRSGPLTPKKAFAEAQAYYEGKQGRYVYQRAEITSTPPEGVSEEAGFGENMIGERWYDTVTGNERSITRNSNGEIVDQSLRIDGAYYFDHGAYEDLGAPTIEINGEEISLPELYVDENNNDIEDIYEQIGFSSHEELREADLSMKEEDDLFEKAGLGRINEEFFLNDGLGGDLPDEVGLTQQDHYELKPSELDKLYQEAFPEDYEHVEPTPAELQEAYEACVASEAEFEKLSKLEIFYTGNATPAEYAKTFAELSNDDFFKIEEAERNGREVYKLTYSSESDEIEGLSVGGETIYLDRQTFSLVAIEADYGEFGGSFKMEITDEVYSDDPFDLSTEGFEKTPVFINDTDSDSEEEFGFGCEDLFDPSNLEDHSSFGPGTEVLEIEL